MKDPLGNGLAYVEDVDGVSWYDMYVEDRVVFKVSVDNADPLLTIHVHHPELLRGFKTNGHAVMGLHSYQVGPGEGDVEVREHINSHSLHRYVYTRLTHLLADVYRPKAGVTLVSGKCVCGNPYDGDNMCFPSACEKELQL